MKVDVRILTFGLILLFFNLYNAAVTFAAVKILKQPDNVIVFEGSRARMAVQAKGAPKISYQWKKDGAVLPGQTRSSLTFSSASKSHRGHYTVDVTGRGRTVTSQSAVFLAQQP